jgi:hypothetical protein
VKMIMSGVRSEATKGAVERLQGVEHMLRGLGAKRTLVSISGKKTLVINA